MKTFVALLATVALTACAGATPTMAPSPSATALASPSPDPQPAQLRVVTTTTVLADFVGQVAGDRAVVHALVPAGVDSHTFDPSPGDAARVSQADLLVMNGLGLDEWLQAFIDQAGAGDVPLIELAEDLEGVDYLESDEHHDDDHDDDEDEHAYNPHLWMNVQYARLYVGRLADELSTVDPAGEADYRVNAAVYDAELEELDEWIRERLAVIPDEDRQVVSFHHAFPYFAQAYDLEIVGVLVEAPGREPSPGEVAELIREIREHNVRLIFAEAQFSDQLAQTLAAETDAVVISTLYTDALGDPPADTFVGAMRWNVEQILQVRE
jgi:ABC-type Zn uptake system ZnuABC Zn-binding protein ZnuA